MTGLPSVTLKDANAAAQVLYIPTAKALTHGGTFRQHESGGWDNPENARLLLDSLLRHHEAQLDSMPAPTGSEPGSSSSSQHVGAASAEAQLDSMPDPAGAEAASSGSNQSAEAASAEAELNSMPAPEQAEPGGTEAGAAASLGDIARAAMDPLQGSLPVQAVLDILDHLLQQDQVCRAFHVSAHGRAVVHHEVSKV